MQCKCAASSVAMVEALHWYL